jgi:hypothetical protein
MSLNLFEQLCIDLSNRTGKSVTMQMEPTLGVDESKHYPEIEMRRIYVDDIATNIFLPSDTFVGNEINTAYNQLLNMIIEQL